MLSSVKPSHCVAIQLDIYYDTELREGLSWSIFDNNGREVTKSDDQAATVSQQSTFLSLPEGSYQLLLKDSAFGTSCCSYGKGGIAIYQEGTLIVEANGSFRSELMLAFEVSKENNINELLHMTDESLQELQIPMYTNSPTMSPTSQPTPSPTPEDVSHRSHEGALIVESKPESSPVLRIEILYDMNPEETGWFLINTDTNEEVFASRFTHEQRNEDNIGKSQQLELIEFDQTQVPAGYHYWFLIADAAGNGICCDHGNGGIRIVQMIHENNTLWESNGQYQTYAEVHFEL
jgi:hypothetical protein